MRGLVPYLAGLFWLGLDTDEDVQLFHQGCDTLGLHLYILFNVKHQHQGEAALWKRTYMHRQTQMQTHRQTHKHTQTNQKNAACGLHLKQGFSKWISGTPYTPI